MEEIFGRLTDLEDQKKELIEQISHIWKDKKEHIIKRYILWEMYADKDSDECYYTSLRKYVMFEDTDHETQDILDQMEVYLDGVGFPYVFSDDDGETMICSIIDVNGTINEGIDWFESLSDTESEADIYESNKEFISNLMNDILDHEV